MIHKFVKPYPVLMQPKLVFLKAMKCMLVISFLFCSSIWLIFLCITQSQKSGDKAQQSSVIPEDSDFAPDI